MKHLGIAAAAMALLAAGAFIGSGYLHTRREERMADNQRAAVHAMSQQDLAAVIARCDRVPAGNVPRDAAAQRDAAARHDAGVARRDAAYCEEAAREMDNRPLEIVNHTPPAPMLPTHR